MLMAAMTWCLHPPSHSNQPRGLGAVHTSIFWHELWSLLLQVCGEGDGIEGDCVVPLNSAFIEVRLSIAALYVECACW